MKRSRRLFTLILAFAMIMCTFVPSAFAVDGTLSDQLAPGEVKALKTVSGPDADGNYTINLSVQGKDAETVTPSAADVILVVDNSGSMGYCCGDLDRRHICKVCGTQNSFWARMCYREIDRLDTAKTVGAFFARSILQSGTDNRLGVIGFASGDHSTGGTNNNDAKVLTSLGKNINDVNNAIDRMEAGGGTNYTAALDKAYSILNGRKGAERNRPAYVIFISDGAPGAQGTSHNDTNWNGANQAADIKESGAQLYTIGISLDNDASAYLRGLATDPEHYKNVTGDNYAAQLESVMSQWAQEINAVSAGTNAVMTDIVNTEKFEVVTTSSDITSTQTYGEYVWNIGDITEEVKSQTITIKPLQPGTDIPTNNDVSLTYDDYTGQSTTLGKDKIGDPTVDVAQATFKVVNGTWADGASADKTTLIPLDVTDGKGTLPQGQVPTGMTANQGFEGGSWDVTPDTSEGAVTGNVTYTYTFEEHQPVITDTAVTFKVVNGTWADGTTEDKIVMITLTDGVGTLPQDQVPTGMTANQGFEGGSWDVTPNTAANAVTGNVTYTYTFTEHQVVQTKATVTFKVVNGTWDGTDSADKQVTVTLYDGIGTLPAGLVPTGMTANQGFEGGSWDVTPDTSEGAVTGNVTYTYTFEEHQPVITDTAVTFKVVNGTWADGTTEDKIVMITLTDGVGTLPQDQVPEGMIAKPNFENGAWDVTPNTAANAVTGNVTYTYTFTEHQVVQTRATVTFKVVNGTWDGTDSADEQVTVTLYDGIGTLPAGLVPTGMTANQGFEGGSWDVTPDTSEGAVTGDVTYTYTFTEHQPVITDTFIIFKVLNGSWADGTIEDKQVSVTLYDGKGTLNSSDVPTGMIANTGYGNGAWDVTPNTSVGAVTGSVVYTYAFHSIYIPIIIPDIPDPKPLPDPEVPLDDEPGDDEPGDDDTIIDDEPTPLAENDDDSNVPKTGDSNNFALWIALLFISGFGLAGTAYNKKKSVK